MELGQLRRYRTLPSSSHDGNDTYCQLFTFYEPTGKMADDLFLKEGLTRDTILIIFG